MTRFEHAFGQVSGHQFEPSANIGLRWEANGPFGPGNGESHVVERRGDKLHVSFAVPGRLAGIWRAETGALYVAHEAGTFYVREAVDSPWITQHVDGALAGVWGLDETGDVYGWGFAAAGEAVFYKRSAGGEFEATAAPASPILELHGARPGLLVGVGPKGAIHALEDGVWRTIESPTTATLSSIFVVSDEEMYACGTGPKFVLQGSLSGWKKRGPLTRHFTVSRSTRTRSMSPAVVGGSTRSPKGQQSSRRFGMIGQ